MFMRNATSNDPRLAGLSKGATGIVQGIRNQSALDSALELRLTELGFVQGERFEVLAEAWPGRDPIVVRIGATTLALRRREAASIAVRLDPPERTTESVFAQRA
jgi:ferrous iron transport protein A